MEAVNHSGSHSGFVPKNKGTKQLFKNPILEKLSRTHISIPITIFVLYASGLLYWSITHTALNALTTTGMFVFGFVAFTWVEYMTHRYVFHMGTFTRMREKLQYTIHGVHHEFPKDKTRLAMPPLLSITVATLLLLGFRLILGDLVFSFLPGFRSFRDFWSGMLFIYQYITWCMCTNHRKIFLNGYGSITVSITISTVNMCLVSRPRFGIMCMGR
jgi:hypothetical protein